jgi:predicted ABC-type transport system involved in lysophospholipase L1 biosynthesis ATPase subunit
LDEEEEGGGDGQGGKRSRGASALRDSEHQDKLIFAVMVNGLPPAGSEIEHQEARKLHEEIVQLLLEIRRERGVTLVVATHDARVRARFPRSIQLAPPR